MKNDKEAQLKVGAIIRPPEHHGGYYSIAFPDGLEAGQFSKFIYSGMGRSRLGYEKLIVVCVAGINDPLPMYSSDYIRGDEKGPSVGIYDGRGATCPPPDCGYGDYGVLAMSYVNGKIPSDAKIVRFFTYSLSANGFVPWGDDKLKYDDKALADTNIPALIKDWQTRAARKRTNRKKLIEKIALTAIEMGLNMDELEQWDLKKALENIHQQNKTDIALVNPKERKAKTLLAGSTGKLSSLTEG